MSEPSKKKVKTSEKMLIFGAKTGWVGGWLIEECKSRGIGYVIAQSRLENRPDVLKEIEEVKPTHVINSAGLTGRPTVDWCEDHKQEVIKANVCGVLLLADVCEQKGIHMTNVATGCIFEYDATHKIGGKGFTEDEKPNFFGSFYSETKAMVEGLLDNYPNVLTLRVRMPISDDLMPRNFVTKIANYAKVASVPNSMTVLHTMVPIIVESAQRKVTGILNLCNPGPISHNEILTMYRDIVDPSFTWENFTTEECRAILKAGRSNNTLDDAKIKKLFPNVAGIHEACKTAFERMKVKIDKEGVDALVAKGWRFPPSSLKALKK